jgi:hypothetical protein
MSALNIEEDNRSKIDVVGGSEGRRPIVNPNIPYKGNENPRGVPPQTKYFNPEVEELGMIWTTESNKKAQQTVSGALATVVGEVEGTEWEITTVEFGPSQMQIAVLGGQGSTNSYYTSIMNGSFHGYEIGISVPTKIGKNGGIEYSDLWERQVEANIDAMVQQQVLCVLEQVLRTPPLMLERYKFLHQKARMTPFQFRNEYEYKFVNLFKKLKGFVEYYAQSETYMDMLYPGRREVKKKSSAYGNLIPVVVSYETAIKPKDSLLLYANALPGKVNAPLQSVVDWQRITDDARTGFIIAPPLRTNEIEGKQYLAINIERPRILRMKPVNLMNGQFINEESITILDDEKHENAKITMKSCLRHLLSGGGINDGDKDEFFLKWFRERFFFDNSDQENNEYKIRNLAEFVKLVVWDDQKIKKTTGDSKLPTDFCIKKNQVIKSPGDYYSQLASFTRDCLMKGKHSAFDSLGNGSLSLFVSIGDKDQSAKDRVAAFQLYNLAFANQSKETVNRVELVKNLAFEESTDFDLIIQNMKVDSLKILAKSLERSFETIEESYIRSTLLSFAENDIPVPFGIIAVTNSIMRGFATPHFRKGGVSLVWRQIMPTLQIDTKTGWVTGNIFREIGTYFFERRDAQIFRETFTIDCICGGGTEFAEYVDNEESTDDSYDIKVEDYRDIESVRKRHSGLKIIPVTLNEVMTAENLKAGIDITGFDDEEYWGEGIEKVRSKDNTASRYYSTCMRARSLFKWRHFKQNEVVLSDYFFDSNLILHDTLACLRQTIQSDGRTDSEEGPYKSKPSFWTHDEPIMNVKQTSENPNIGGTLIGGFGNYN